MKQSRKVELFNRINNVRSNKNQITLSSSKDAKKYLELLYKEGKVSSYTCINNKLTVIVNENFNVYNEKISLQSVKNRPSLKYYDIVKIRPLLKTAYFHSNSGLLSLHELKKEKRGGVPVFYI